MTLEKDPNFEEKLSFCLKNSIRNLVEFNPSSGKSANLHFDGLSLQKDVMFELKKYRRVASWKIIDSFKMA